MDLTIAEQLAVKAEVNELGAFEIAVELAASLSEHSTHTSYRFDDNSVVNIFISEDHEITVMAV
ncbi:hypothetical protein [Aliivibrio salmonicida]|uniref:hypothetical protein n=1 Tax=Aliivibrio salmonicida TaxID=40269 RepID=UPI003D123B1D